jgi:3'-phosphoadenosine 5'-phosphosulfate sulfotransferase (PAPS reductase)/FAD synthetase
MSTDNLSPYRIEGPALISFSGGRTSAYMLHEILRAHDGALPADVHVVFANTGKEREETLRFVHECSEHWGVNVTWVERTFDVPGFEIVSHNSASRNGEPFARVIQRRGFLPNAVARFCTIELKVRAMRNFMKGHGYRTWTNAVGLRYDEGHRIFKGIARNESGKDPWTTIWPLSTARVTKRDVLAFWKKQPFDLGLHGVEGNCDLCFLKGKDKLLSLMRRNPDAALWWIEQEASVVRTATPAGARFVTEYSYRGLADLVRDQGTFFDVLDDASDEFDTECGLTCGAAA